MPSLSIGAEAGNPLCQLALGKAYASGDGVPEVSDEDALVWCRLSAEQGNAEAMFNLGVAASQGRGVKKDQIQAARWYNLAKYSNGQVICNTETETSRSCQTSGARVRRTGAVLVFASRDQVHIPTFQHSGISIIISTFI